MQSWVRQSCLIGLMALAGIYTGFSATYYVATNGNDTSGEGSLASPWLTISNGVARATAAGDTVLVGNGVYVLTTNIVVAKAVQVASLAGAAGTMIDANWQGRCFYIGHSNAVVDGFTLTNGNAATDGGAVYLTNGIIRNCNITSNYAAGAGGGIYCYNAGIVANCTVAVNRAGTQGGGIYSYLGAITNCLIVSNVSGTYGGGAWLQGATMHNCQIIGNSNTANTAGGVYSRNSAIINNCLIQGNRSPNGGGGIQVIDGVVVSNCIITTNIGTYYGGGVHMGSGVSLITHCAVVSNALSGGYGGGIYIEYAAGNRVENSRISHNYCAANSGGGIAIGVGRLSYAVIRNCLISKNSAPSNAREGGGIYGGEWATWSSGALVDSCTIVENRANRANSGGVFFTTTNYYMTNCIVYSNTTVNVSTDPDVFHVRTNLNVAYSCSPKLTNSAGCITSYPAFADSAAYDYRLTADSPCIDAGTNLSWMSGGADLDGRARIDGFRRAVDMGAYEYLARGVMINIR